MRFFITQLTYRPTDCTNPPPTEDHFIGSFDNPGDAIIHWLTTTVPFRDQFYSESLYSLKPNGDEKHNGFTAKFAAQLTTMSDGLDIHIATDVLDIFQLCLESLINLKSRSTTHDTTHPNH